MISRLALQLVVAGTLLASFRPMPVYAQSPETPADARPPAPGWPEPVKDQNS
jgi:hypothetical protein